MESYFGGYHFSGRVVRYKCLSFLRKRGPITFGEYEGKWNLDTGRRNKRRGRKQFNKGKLLAIF